MMAPWRGNKYEEKLSILYRTVWVLSRGREKYLLLLISIMFRFGYALPCATKKQAPDWVPVLAEKQRFAQTRLCGKIQPIFPLKIKHYQPKYRQNRSKSK
ncbi:MAG: hypothetical protein IJX53_00445 [Clostridia bacterium]|nr:hypothetical protein [Clostridia bacterium]